MLLRQAAERPAEPEQAARPREVDPLEMLQDEQAIRRAYLQFVAIHHAAGRLGAREEAAAHVRVVPAQPEREEDGTVAPEPARASPPAEAADPQVVAAYQRFRAAVRRAEEQLERELAALRVA